MELFDLAEQAKTKEDFIKFLHALIEDFNTNKENEYEWQNPELGSYLEAMEAFLTDSTEESLVKVDFTPSWSLFARILLTAKIYE